MPERGSFLGTAGIDKTTLCSLNLVPGFASLEFFAQGECFGITCPLQVLKYLH